MEEKKNWFWFSNNTESWRWPQSKSETKCAIAKKENILQETEKQMRHRKLNKHKFITSEKLLATIEGKSVLSSCYTHEIISVWTQSLTATPPLNQNHKIATKRHNRKIRETALTEKNGRTIAKQTCFNQNLEQLRKRAFMLNSKKSLLKKIK